MYQTRAINPHRTLAHRPLRVSESVARGTRAARPGSQVGHSRMPQRAAVKLVGRVGFGGWDRRRRYDFQFHPWTYDAPTQVDAWKHVNFVDLQCLRHTYSVKKWRRVGKPLERRRHVNSRVCGYCASEQVYLCPCSDCASRIRGAPGAARAEMSNADCASHSDRDPSPACPG